MAESARYRPKPSLLETMREMACARGKCNPKLLLHIKQSLERGADPNLDVGGANALAMLFHTQYHSDWGSLREATLLLMEHGANATTGCIIHGKKVTLLAQLSRDAVVNDTSNATAWAHLAGAVVEGICKQQDRGLFTPSKDGNNPLHVVCTYGIEVVPYLFEKNLFRQEWVVQTNDQGDTPLHCLWKNRTVLTELLEFEQMDRTINALWQATADLVSHGADLNHPNAKGKNTVAMIKKMLKKGLRTQQAGAWPAIETFIQAAEIGANTPTAEPGAPLMRL